jgi:hypothetical protein
VVVMKNNVVVSVYDTALDVHAMTSERTIQEWMQSRDPSLEKEVAGKKLTRFHLTPIPRSVISKYVRGAADDAERNERAFAAGVAKIENLSAALPSLEPRGKVDAAAGKVPLWTPTQLEQISEAYVQDIGWLCWWRSFLAHETEPLCPVQPSSLSTIAHRISRAAAAHQKAQTMTDTDESSV